MSRSDLKSDDREIVLTVNRFQRIWAFRMGRRVNIRYWAANRYTQVVLFCRVNCIDLKFSPRNNIDHHVAEMDSYTTSHCRNDPSVHCQGFLWEYSRCLIV